MRIRMIAVLSVATLLAACGGSDGMGAKKSDEALRAGAVSTDQRAYFLGPRYGGLELDDAVVDVPHRLVSAWYGTCPVSFGESMCSPPLEVQTMITAPGDWENTVDCARVADVRGVPALDFGDALQLLTGASVVTIAVIPPDSAKARRVASALREVTESQPTGDLPAPNAALMSAIDDECGSEPGQHGQLLEDLEGQDTAAKNVVADFSVPRLGGGELRWRDYVGRPVVVIVGDVSQVAAATRRMVRLRRGASPAVIGLIWSPFGAKSSPPMIGDIEVKAGALPCPVGYAAVPMPAVWFTDSSGIDPADAGVVAYVDASGRAVAYLETSADDHHLRTQLESLLDATNP